MQAITKLTQKPLVMKLLTTMRIVFFVLGVIMTISTSQIFKSCRQPHGQLAVVPPLVEQAEQQKVLKDYDQQITKLTTQNAALKQEVADSKTALSRTKRRAALLESQLEEQVSTASILTDTTDRLSNCDIIVQTAIALSASAAERDSLYTELTGALEQQIINRDSTFSIQQEQHNYLLSNYDRSISQQQLLLSENLQLHQDVKQRRVKNRILSAGLLLLSGTITYMVLHH